MANDTPPILEIEKESVRLVSEVESLLSSVFGVMIMTQAMYTAKSEKWNAFLERKGEPVVDEQTGHTTYLIKAIDFEEKRRLRSDMEQAERAVQVVPRSFVVSLSSTFDAYLGRLIRELFLSKTELLRTIQKKLSLVEMQAFESIEQVQDHLLDEEIEGVLREGRRKQFGWMEERFEVALTKGLDCWPAFVELSERRNLFVHTDAVVSKQYKKVCSEVKFPWSGREPAVGAVLDVSNDYFQQACNTTLEVGLKLCWVLWRKLLPSQSQEQDRNLIRVTFQLISDDRHELAAQLLDLACSERSWKFFSANNRLTCKLNLAQALKWAGRAPKCLEVLKSEDWGPTSPKYRLAALVLSDQFTEAEAVMLKTVATEELSEADFALWPLFREFRKSENFRRAFRAAFQKDFSTIEEAVGRADETDGADPASAN